MTKAMAFANGSVRTVLRGKERMALFLSDYMYATNAMCDHASTQSTYFLEQMQTIYRMQRGRVA